MNAAVFKLDIHSTEPASLEILDWFYSKMETAFCNKASKYFYIVVLIPTVNFTPQLIENY